MPIALPLPLPMLAGMQERGDAPALITDDITLTYAELADRIEDAASRLGPGRRLAGLALGNDLSSVVLYLAALTAGHAVVVAPPCRLGEVTAGVRPGVLIDGPSGAISINNPPHSDLHPDLALLLSTSGSTGQPKLVRLSYGNVHSNAAAIAQYLAIRPTDRAIITLPLHYCYGLSVLHSHLLAGAAVVLTDRSVTDPAFGDLLEGGVTTLPGVPHTFDLLDQAGISGELPRSLRTVTQAGGRMAPDRVQHWAQMGQQRGFDFFVMYGQTEATARMLYLPPDLAAEHSTAVGVPIPGGSVRIDPIDGASDGVGELVYAGPNVMMGYAELPSDLVRGPGHEELRTGDLARISEAGLVEIVGRRSRFAKIFGLRLDLQGLETTLARADQQAWCMDGGDRLLAACTGDPASVRRLLSGATGLPLSAVAVNRVVDVPRTSGGKPDYPALRRQLEPAPRPDLTAATAAEVYAAVLCRDVQEIRPGDTFVSLGGDSLTYVASAAALERSLGHLPPDWHVTPVADLLPQAERSRFWRRVETSALLRAVSIIVIVASHIGIADLRGGAHLLIALAGFNFARFRLSSGVQIRPALASVANFAVPAGLYMALVAALTAEYGASIVFGINLFGPAQRAPEWRYWFVEALVFVLLAAIATLALGGRLHRRSPFGFALALLAAALALRFTLTGDEPPTELFTPVAVGWLFAAGWALALARGHWQKVLVLMLVLVGLAGYFDDFWRAAFVFAGIVLVVVAPTLRVPGAVAPAVATIAAASLWIYLTHWQVYPRLDRWELLALAASLLVGVAVHRAEVALRAHWSHRQLTHKGEAPASAPVLLDPARA